MHVDDYMKNIKGLAGAPTPLDGAQSAVSSSISSTNSSGPQRNAKIYKQNFDNKNDSRRNNYTSNVNAGYKDRSRQNFANR
jgi:hypothetical protein